MGAPKKWEREVNRALDRPGREVLLREYGSLASARTVVCFINNPVYGESAGFQYFTDVFAFRKGNRVYIVSREES